MVQKIAGGNWGLVFLIAAALLVGCASAIHDVGDYHSFSTTVDDTGTTHISFGAGTHYSDLWYAAMTKDGKTIATEKVDNAINTGYDSYIYVKNGRIYIVYRNGNTYGDLWLASKLIGNTSWTKVKVDDGGSYRGNTGYTPVVYVDKDGMICISYCEKRPGFLDMVKWAKGWDPAGPFITHDVFEDEIRPYHTDGVV